VLAHLHGYLSARWPERIAEQLIHDPAKFIGIEVGLYLLGGQL
jgi:hypothetical protein